MSDDEIEEEQQKPFAVERAKTGRAKCKKCKCPIDKDCVRLAKMMKNPFGDGTMKSWHHVSCLFEVFAKQRATTKRIDDPEEDISGWEELDEEDKKLVLKKLEEFNENTPFKGGAKPKKASTTNEKKPKTESPTKGKTGKTKKDEEVKIVEKSSDEKKPSKDDMFREFRRICCAITDVSAYTEKTAILKRMFTKGSTGDGFKSDIVLWCKLLLPGTAKRIYNLQSKQLIKLFARILKQEESSMLEDLEQGDIGETISSFFSKSDALRPNIKSVITIQEVEKFLAKLSTMTKEVEQMNHFKSFIVRCTENDLKMIIRLIKHDLRINAGPKHILEAIDKDAYTAFQVSNDLEAVIQRCLGAPSSSNSDKTSASDSKKDSIKKKVALTVMTPVLPMLAEACKSVEMAMKKCPDGMLSEVKYDGERVQVHKKGDEFRYFSRSLKPVMEHKVKTLKDFIPQAFPNADDLILDAEILMIDTRTGQPLPFGTLGIHKRAEFKDANVCLFVFDCIYMNGEILLNKTMKERREILENNLTEIPNRIKLSEIQEINKPKDLAEMIAKVLKLGLEGLVLKSVNSKYEPGKRHWLKVKKDYLCQGAMADTADLVVLGAWYGTGHKGGMMSVFLMGCYDTDRDVWLTVTKVHTGHDDATLEKLQDELDMVKIGKDPSLVPKWMKANKPMIPDFVARDPKNQPVWEITGAEFTNQGVHTADGISIRFPRVTRIRSDKNWETATNLNELRNLFKTSTESTDFSLLLASTSKDSSEESKKSKTTAKKEKKTKTDSKGTGTLDVFMKREIKNEPNSPEKSPKKRQKIEKVKLSVNARIEDSFIDTSDEEKCEEKIKQELDTITSDDGDNLKVKKVKKEVDKYEIDDHKYRKEATRKRNSREKIEIGEFSGKAPVIIDENKAKLYSFHGNDYIEYNEKGIPLNWIEGRKPPEILPGNAKSLTQLDENELNSKCVLRRNIRVTFAKDYKRKERRRLARTLKTLGATVILDDEDLSTTTHMIHSSIKVPASILQEYSGVPTYARHVHQSWVENCASESKMQDPSVYAVILTGVYCTCPCPHGR